MYIGMIQAMRDYLIELNTSMQQHLGTTSPFPLASVPEDDMFTADMRECMAYLTSDLREFLQYLPEENAPAMDPDMEVDPGMASFSYYANLAIIIGRHS